MKKIPDAVWEPVTKTLAVFAFLAPGFAGLFLVSIGEMPVRDTATSVLFIFAGQGMWRLAPWLSKPKKPAAPRKAPKEKPAKVSVVADVGS